MESAVQRAGLSQPNRQFGPNLAECWSVLAKHVANFCQFWANLGQFWANAGQFSPEFDTCLHNLPQNCPKWPPLWPPIEIFYRIWADLCENRSNSRYRSIFWYISGSFLRKLPWEGGPRLFLLHRFRTIRRLPQIHVFGYIRNCSGRTPLKSCYK